MRIVNVLEHMHGRAHYTGGWWILVDAIDQVEPGHSDKLNEWKARMLMRAVEAMCGYSV